MTSTAGPTSHLRLAPMRARDPDEPGRAASSLELFFDLVFVVAVSITAQALHHELTEGHVVHGVVSFLLVFFAIWWAWMNFTWFATSFATDDWLYRVLTILQMGGVLVLAAGVEAAFTERDFLVMTLGYVVMRLAMVSQWLRAAARPGPWRRTALAYAAGITLVQVGWLLRLLLPDGPGLVGFLVLLVAELAVPVLAEQAGETTPWHPHHITERYGLFTLILLGESLLASANAIIEAVHAGEHVVDLGVLAALTLLVTAAMWWIYFWAPHHEALTGMRQALRYGYVHYVVFAAAGAFSAGVEVVIDGVADHSELGRAAGSLTAAVPVAVFVVSVWWVAMRARADRAVNVALPVAALLVLLDPLVPVPLLLSTVVVVGVVVLLVVHPPRAAHHTAA